MAGAGWESTQGKASFACKATGTCWDRLVQERSLELPLPLAGCAHLLCHSMRKVCNVQCAVSRFSNIR